MGTLTKNELKNQDFAGINNNGTIYFLINDNNQTIYVGKSKNITYRFQRHEKKKDFNKIIGIVDNFEQ